MTPYHFRNLIFKLIVLTIALVIFPTQLFAREHVNRTDDKRLRSAGDPVFASTLLGNYAMDQATCLAIAPDESVYVAGATRSSQFPATDNSFQNSFTGGQEAFITRFDPYLCADEFTCLPGDLNNDGRLQVLDKTILGLYLAGRIPQDTGPFLAPSFAADINSDSLIDASDLVLLANMLTDNWAPFFR